jgi:hypothetical protein
MRITCPKCKATIEIEVTAFELNRFRWGTNDFPKIASQCLEWQDPTNADAKARNECGALDTAVIEAIKP